MAHQVTIYSTPTCGYCRMAKEFFRQNNIQYSDVDVSQDQAAAQAMIARSGQMGVPQIDIDGKIIVGFDKGAIKQALGLL
ncbi:MAG: glutaredoxin family protein [Candidatus Omnitrophota bacterium]